MPIGPSIHGVISPSELLHPNRSTLLLNETSFISGVLYAFFILVFASKVNTHVIIRPTAVKQRCAAFEFYHRQLRLGVFFLLFVFHFSAPIFSKPFCLSKRHVPWAFRSACVP